MEIIDANGDLIGNDDVPTTGADLESRANNTTDYNAGVGQQPFRYDMLGRFGFTMMPFGEGKGDKLVDNDGVVQLAHDMFMKTIEYYYRNPNKLKSDYRLLTGDKDEPNSERDSVEERWAEVMMKLLKPYFDDKKSLDESKVAEDKMFSKKNEDEISEKGEDKGVRDKKLEKIAGLINKLDKDDINKLKNLLEINNG